LGIEGQMSAAREELARLAAAVPDDSVPAAIAVLRPLAEEPRPETGTWPPPWIGAGQSTFDRTSERVDELMESEGFGAS
jgi:hypothetical protein